MSVPCEMLLHPELLSNEQLICVIHERHLRVPNIEKMSRDELLDLFHNYCVPYGQRKHRESGRGRGINKTQQPSPEAAAKPSLVNGNNRQLKLKYPGSDRLKPPPDLLSGHLKRVKLELETPEQTIKTTIIQISNDFVNCKRKIVEAATESSPAKRERKQITWP